MPRHHRYMAAGIMAFIPSTPVAKLGVASTFILGAAVGNHLRKQRSKFVDITKEERRHLHVAGEVTKNSVVRKRCDIISKIYMSLQSILVATSVDDSVTTFYTDRARKLCHTYLSSWGILEKSAEISLENWIEESDWIDNTDYWPKLPALRSYHQPSYSSALSAGVTALWHLSCIKDFCKGKAFVDTDLTRTLLQITEEKDSPTTSVILKILANVLAVQENQQVFHDAGLTAALKKFSEDSLPELFIPAWRGLHNLRQMNEKESSQQGVYVEGVYPFNPPYLDKVENPSLDIVLVHGIRGRASWTWRQHDQEKFKPLLTQEQRKNLLTRRGSEDLDALYTCCWPLDWLMASLEIPVRILAVEYDAEWQISGNKCAIEARGKTISHHAKDIAESLKAARVGDRPIIWISHSMGGLIVKQMLVNSLSTSQVANCALDRDSSKQIQSMFNKEELIKDTHILQEDNLSFNRLAAQTLGVVFFSVPHHGAPIASLVSQPLVRQVFNPSTEVYEMREESSLLSKIHKSFVNLVKSHGIRVLTLQERVPMHLDFLGLDMHFVPSKHGDPGIGTFCEVDASHRDICKPLSRKSESYQKVAEFFQVLIKNL